MALGHKLPAGFVGTVHDGPSDLRHRTATAPKGVRAEPLLGHFRWLTRMTLQKNEPGQIGRVGQKERNAKLFASFSRKETYVTVVGFWLVSEQQMFGANLVSIELQIISI